MANKKDVTPTRRVKVFSKDYSGYLDEMPEDKKEKMFAKFKKNG